MAGQQPGLPTNSISEGTDSTAVVPVLVKVVDVVLWDGCTNPLYDIDKWKKKKKERKEILMHEIGYVGDSIREINIAERDVGNVQY